MRILAVVATAVCTLSFPSFGTADDLTAAEKAAVAQKAFDDVKAKVGAFLDKNDFPYVQADRKILEGKWVAIDSPNGNQFSAAARAQAISGNLDSALVQIDCLKTADGPELKVGLGYWLRGKAFDDDGYRMDVFDSVGSGRPAAYELGMGPVSTAHIRGPGLFSTDPMPEAYFVAMSEFYRTLASGQASEVSITFKGGRRAPEEIFSASFPLDGLDLAMAEMQRYCPISPVS